MSTETTSTSPQAMRLVRVAMLMGIVAFGAVAWLMHRSGTGTRPVENLVPLRWAGLGLLMAAAGAVFAMRAAADARNGDAFARRSRFALLSWAVAEVAAVFGAAYYFLSGAPLLYLAGTGLFVIALIVHPVPTADERG